MRKKLLAVLLCVIMVLALLPSTALADDEGLPNSGDGSSITEQSGASGKGTVGAEKSSVTTTTASTPTASPTTSASPSPSASPSGGTAHPGSGNGGEEDDDTSGTDEGAVEVSPKIKTAPLLRAGEKTVLNISKGNITIGDGAVSGVDDNGDTVNTLNTNGYIITGTSTNEYTVSVTDGDRNITLQNVSIDAGSSGLPAFDINPDATVNLTLEGTNTLKAYGNLLFGGPAALRVPLDAAVTIGGTGSLTAEAVDGAAAIGSNGNEDFGAITINSGTVTAVSNGIGAGIGGGLSGVPNPPGKGNGAVTINGGTVVASSTQGAGIGGALGSDSSCGTITINGGNVIATGGPYSAGIGGGNGNARNGQVIITGGNIKATGGTYADDVGEDRNPGGSFIPISSP